MAEKCVVTAALTGILARREQCPYLPYTPKEIADEAVRAAEAGASIVHIHARTDEGYPCFETPVYQQIYDLIRERSDVIINFSTGAVGVPMEQRVGYIRDVRPEIAALNMGSMNYAIYSSKNKRFYYDLVFANPFGDIIQLLEVMNQAGVRPELECFDTGHIGNTAPLIDMGILKPPYQFSLIMGVLGGIPATTRNLIHQVDNLPQPSFWQVIGVSRVQWQLVAAAITLGGNVRVGLEDNFYLPNGDMAKSNAELVEEAVRLCRILGREVTTPTEAREILKL